MLDRDIRIKITNLCGCAHPSFHRRLDADPILNCFMANSYTLIFHYQVPMTHGESEL